MSRFATKTGGVVLAARQNSDLLSNLFDFPEAVGLAEGEEESLFGGRTHFSARTCKNSGIEQDARLSHWVRLTVRNPRFNLPKQIHDCSERYFFALPIPCSFSTSLSQLHWY